MISKSGLRKTSPPGPTGLHMAHSSVKAFLTRRAPSRHPFRVPGMADERPSPLPSVGVVPEYAELAPLPEFPAEARTALL